jgi:quercetin dioxygenase-like cupin family protein
MRIVDFTATRATPVAEYDSRGAAALRLGDGSGEAHAYAVHIAPGGVIGAHPAGFGQLFLVAEGAGWIAGADGVRHDVRVGTGAYIARGELHAKGSDTGLTAIMIQVTELTPTVEALA